MTQEFDCLAAGANCFLLRGRSGFVLIDTGPEIARRRLLRGLERAGCEAQDPRLIVITHGDVDHIGNCAYLQRTRNAKVALHEIEARAIESSDVAVNRKESPDRLPWLFKALRPIGGWLGRAEPFKPDLLLEDGQDLSEHGIDATVVHLPGHSRGSIAVLTGGGDLFCGDLFWNTRRPRLHPLIDDLPAARASIQRLRELPVTTVHPAHGRPFPASVLDQQFPT